MDFNISKFTTRAPLKLSRVYLNAVSNIEACMRRERDAQAALIESVQQRQFCSVEQRVVRVGELHKQRLGALAEADRLWRSLVAVRLVAACFSRKRRHLTAERVQVARRLLGAVSYGTRIRLAQHYMQGKRGTPKIIRLVFQRALLRIPPEHMHATQAIRSCGG